LELGGERGLAQGLPCHGGDAVEVGTVAGRKAGTSRTPGRVCRSEHLSGPVMLAAECLRTSQAGERLRHSLLVTEFLRGVEGLQVP
jgi:hypothetical protein